MNPDLRPGQGPPTEAGTTMLDVLAGLTLLAFVVGTLMNVFLVTMREARTSGVDAEAAAWVQAEMDYLRGRGYWDACLAGGERVIPPGADPCTHTALPSAFAQARVLVEDDALGRPGLKRVTVELHRPLGTVFYRVVTYATSFQ